MGKPVISIGACEPEGSRFETLSNDNDAESQDFTATGTAASSG